MLCLYFILVEGEDDYVCEVCVLCERASMSFVVCSVQQAGCDLPVQLSIQKGITVVYPRHYEFHSRMTRS